MSDNKVRRNIQATTDAVRRMYNIREGKNGNARLVFTEVFDAVSYDRLRQVKVDGQPTMGFRLQIAYGAFEWLVKTGRIEGSVVMKLRKVDAWMFSYWLARIACTMEHVHEVSAAEAWKELIVPKQAVQAALPLE